MGILRATFCCLSLSLCLSVSLSLLFLLSLFLLLILPPLVSEWQRRQGLCPYRNYRGLEVWDAVRV